MAAWEIQGRDAFTATAGPATSGGLGITIQGITTGGFAPVTGANVTQSPYNASGSTQGLEGSPGLTSAPGGFAVPGDVAPGIGGAGILGGLSASDPLLLLGVLAVIAVMVLRR